MSIHWSCAFLILKDLSHVSMVRVFHVSELRCACSKFPCVWRVLFTLYLGLILLPQFPGGLKNLLLSTHLTISDLRFPITVLPVSWCLADSFSFIVIHPIDSRSQIWWGSFLFALAVHHQIHRYCFCCPWAIVWSRVLSSFRHGINHNAFLVWQKELTFFLNGCENMSKNSWY